MKTRIVSVIIAFWFIWATAEALQVQSQTVRPPAPDSKFSDREAAQNAANNRNRLLIHVHGGGYVYNPGEAGAQEGTLMAAYGGFKVISVDYRRPPDYQYPAAMDDAMTVWKAALKMQSPANIAIFGTSTGGGMTLAMVLRAKQEKLPLPGAIAPGTPWSDLTETGDSYKTNEWLDNILVSYNGYIHALSIHSGIERSIQ